MVYNTRTNDEYDWIKNNKEYFDLSESHMEDLRCNDNKKVLGKFKDECNSLLLTEFLALNPKVYSFKYQAVNKEYKDEHKKDLFEISHKEILENSSIDNKRTCKGVLSSSTY